MKRTPFTHEVALLPRREGLKAAVMRGHKSLLGNISWEVEVKGGEKLLTYSKGRWKAYGDKFPEGRVVARERQEQSTQELQEATEYGMTAKNSVDSITIEGQDVDLWLKDLVVAAWCSRIWQSNRITQSRVLFGRMKGKGSF
jgi:hypothetical protein